MCSKGHIQALYLSIIEKHTWSRLYYGQMNKYNLARYFIFASNENTSQIAGNTIGIPWTDTAWPFLFSAWKTGSPGKALKHFSLSD